MDELIGRALKDMDLPSRGRVVVAMSGGVDSSVAAALLHHTGYDVLGVTLQLYDQGAQAARKGACCAGQDIYDAKTVADQMGFAHYVLDYESRFKQAVIESFAESYLRGETPIPCIQCNKEVKFKDLFQVAQDLGAEALVTGHYVQRFRDPGPPTLHQAVDASRDQSYFLFETTLPQLDFLRFPLGGLLKSETRALGAFFGLKVSEKPDSQDICFVNGGSYASVVARLRPESLQPGEIVHLDGRVLGHHEGVIHFTVGQRKGLKIAAPEPLFVVALDAAHHRVIVGPREALARQRLVLRDVNWLIPPHDRPLANQPLACQVKIRSSHTPQEAQLHQTPEGSVQVCLEAPEYGISTGQACVFYTQSQVLGGGWITGTPAPAPPS
jgi:tRNA-specific 2-thiouridylase